MRARPKPPVDRRAELSARREEQRSRVAEPLRARNGDDFARQRFAAERGYVWHHDYGKGAKQRRPKVDRYPPSVIKHLPPIYDERAERTGSDLDQIERAVAKRLRKQTGRLA